MATRKNDSYVTSPRARALMRQMAQNVRVLRQARGWSLKELAVRAGLPPRGLENLENELHAPSFVVVAYLAEVLDVTINQLVYSPFIAHDGRVQNQYGKFVVPTPKSHPPMCECDECWQAMEAGGL
jgi:transcriptional regulator with XRE-family HTH domain